MSRKCLTSFLDPSFLHNVLVAHDGVSSSPVLSGWSPTTSPPTCRRPPDLRSTCDLPVSLYYFPVPPTQPHFLSPSSFSLALLVFLTPSLLLSSSSRPPSLSCTLSLTLSSLPLRSGAPVVSQPGRKRRERRKKKHRAGQRIVSFKHSLFDKFAHFLPPYHLLSFPN